MRIRLAFGLETSERYNRAQPHIVYVRVKLPAAYAQLRAIRFACGECGKSETAWRA